MTVIAVLPTYSKTTLEPCGRGETSVPASGGAALLIVSRTVALFFPQHGIVSLLTVVDRRGGRRLRAGPFQKNSSCREGGPEQQSLSPTFAYEQGEGYCDPEAEAVEAVEQGTPEPTPGQTAQTKQQVPRPVLRVQQMRNPPNT